MRNLIIVIALLAQLTAAGQSLQFNKAANRYQYSHVKATPGPNFASQVVANLQQAGYTNISQTDSTIIADGRTSHLVAGFATVEITYRAIIAFHPDQYKLTLTAWHIADPNGINPLEQIGMYKKAWIKRINKKLPTIIATIERQGAANW